MKELIEQACEMLLGTPLDERMLIYYIAKLNDEDRAAIVLAYQLIHGDYEAESRETTASY